MAGIHKVLSLSSSLSAEEGKDGGRERYYRYRYRKYTYTYSRPTPTSPHHLLTHPTPDAEYRGQADKQAIGSRITIASLRSC